MNVSKILALGAALLLAFSPVQSIAQEAQAIDARLQTQRATTTYTRDSYDTVWITPIYADYMISGQNPERFPTRFVSFEAPQGALLGDYRYDSSVLINTDRLLTYLYVAYDQVSFEAFLERAEQEHIIKDGADGVAIYLSPDSYTADALIDLAPHFEGSPKLQIMINSFDRTITKESLQTLIEDEVARVQASMQIENPPTYWSAGAYNSIEIASSRDPFSAIVDVQGLTVTRFDVSRIITKVAEDNHTHGTEIAIGSYSYPHSMQEDGNQAVKDAALADGTAYKYLHTGHTGYASITLAEDGRFGPVYLTLTLDGEEPGFAQALEELWSRISLSQGE